MSATTANTTSTPSLNSTVVNTCFSDGDRDGYVSVFRRDGGILGSDTRSARYMEDHEALVWNSMQRSQRLRAEDWNRQELARIKIKNAGLDERTCRPTSVASNQTPASQLSFRVLGARLA